MQCAHEVESESETKWSACRGMGDRILRATLGLTVRFIIWEWYGFTFLWFLGSLSGLKPYRYAFFIRVNSKSSRSKRYLFYIELQN